MHTAHGSPHFAYFSLHWILSAFGLQDDTSITLRTLLVAHGSQLTAHCPPLTADSSFAYRLNVRDDLGAFECVLDVRKLKRGLIDSCTENVEAARFLETFGGEFFLRCQKVTRGLPNFLLLEGVHAGCRIPLLVVPHGLDFDKDEFVSIAGDDVEFSATVSVVAG